MSPSTVTVQLDVVSRAHAPDQWSKEKPAAGRVAVIVTSWGSGRQTGLSGPCSQTLTSAKAFEHVPLTLPSSARVHVMPLAVTVPAPETPTESTASARAAGAGTASS